MFQPLSNTTCSNAAFSPETMPGMADDPHETAARLYAAAKLFAATEGKSAVGRLLGETPQNINNWESRGISEGGALKAQAKIGCDANWLLTGEGSMTRGWPFSRIPLERFLSLEPGDRDFIEGQLAAAIERTLERQGKRDASPVHSVPNVIPNDDEEREDERAKRSLAKPPHVNVPAKANKLRRS